MVWYRDVRKWHVLWRNWKLVVETVNFRIHYYLTNLDTLQQSNLAIDHLPFIQCEAPQLCLLVYKPHEYYSYLRTINHRYWSYVNPTLAIERGPPIVYIMEYIYTGFADERRHVLGDFPASHVSPRRVAYTICRRLEAEPYGGFMK